MKQDLYINQANWSLKQTKQKLENISLEKEKGFISEIDYRNSRSRLNGALFALEMDHSKDIHEQIMYNLKMFQKAKKELKVDTLDNEDKNIGLFYLLGGAITQSLILLTAFDNPQSCCPANKEIILGKTINDLEIKLQNALQLKDKKVISELKLELGIITKQYQENLLALKTINEIAV